MDKPNVFLYIPACDQWKKKVYRCTNYVKVKGLACPNQICARNKKTITTFDLLTRWEKNCNIRQDNWFVILVSCYKRIYQMKAVNWRSFLSGLESSRVVIVTYKFWPYRLNSLSSSGLFFNRWIAFIQFPLK